jgi:4-amino-4-deoxy-L-arabinose transferase-like glycosyltransferase
MKKHWDKIIILAIVILAVFLRVYNFSDWLHFGMDQARDANLVSEAVAEGPSHLPLLGPRAGGTFVRLGPIFYYFQYLSAKIFHSVSPPVLAYPDLLFSILTIPLFFLFLRLYFRKATALLVSALYAFNFVIIQFSRFAWNPNSIPFWTLLAFYSLIRASEEENKRKKYLWIFAAVVGWAVAGQLHFVVLAAIPAVIFAFLAWTGKWRSFSWKEWLFALLVLGIFFAPAILSDIKMQGDNAKQFLWAFKYKPQEHSLLENLKASVTIRANYYTKILTTYVSPTGKVSLLGGVALVFFGIFFLCRAYFQEKEEDKKNFLRLLLAWSVISFLVLVPFAFQIKPRFLFFEIFLPFIFVGMGLEWLLGSRKHKKFILSAVTMLVLAVTSLNLEATRAWFGKLETGKKFNVWGNRRSFIQYPKSITLSDFTEAASFVGEKWKENPAKLYFYGNLEMRNPLIYVLEMRNPGIDYGYIGFKTRDFSGRYFSITTENGGLDSLPGHYQVKFDLLVNQKFEKLAVQELKLKDVQPKTSEKESLKDPKAESETEKNSKKGLKKGERVLWEDLF